MKFENIRVYNFENALRGMRNPKNSWHLSDSYYGLEFNDCENILGRTHGQDYVIIYEDKDGGVCEFASIGPNDMELAKKLIAAGSEHRKFLRQIFVTVDITAPLYWWKEADTYKVGTTSNSTSTMHKITSQPITLDCFETDDYSPTLQLIDPIPLCIRTDCFIDDLEQLRLLCLDYQNKAKDESLPKEQRDSYIILAKKYWKELIRWLPESWLQTRTVTMTYENLFTMAHQREYHKLIEWSGKEEKVNTQTFIKFAHSLPYSDDFIFAKST